jgi:hypothetical protein
MDAKYPDAAGYDCEGYGLSTGLHKQNGVRRHYRPRIDTPRTDEERALTERAQAAQRAREAHYATCPQHSWRWLSHEERECSHCGAVEFVADL